MKERKEIVLRMPGKVHEALKEKADEIGVSMNELILWAVDRYLNDDVPISDQHESHP